MSLNKPTIDEILKDGQNYYSLVIGVAKYARQAVEEADDLGIASPDKPVSYAVKKLKEGKYRLIESYDN